jgi:hypothetical protein
VETAAAAAGALAISRGRGGRGTATRGVRGGRWRWSRGGWSEATAVTPRHGMAAAENRKRGGDEAAPILILSLSSHTGMKETYGPDGPPVYASVISTRISKGRNMNRNRN